MDYNNITEDIGLEEARPVQVQLHMTAYMVFTTGLHE
ncbi:hypothetical protein BJP35_2263 [Enterobacter sp. J49]|nr:hypothetical protein BJP35_2263 [Enterobacter sp. J49]